MAYFSPLAFVFYDFFRNYLADTCCLGFNLFYRRSSGDERRFCW